MFSVLVFVILYNTAFLQYRKPIDTQVMHCRFHVARLQRVLCPRKVLSFCLALDGVKDSAFIWCCSSTGVNHEELVNVANTHFSSMPYEYPDDAIPALSPCRFTGSEVRFVIVHILSVLLDCFHVVIHELFFFLMIYLCPKISIRPLF